jgi:hypothetical protein
MDYDIAVIATKVCFLLCMCVATMVGQKDRRIKDAVNEFPKRFTGKFVIELLVIAVPAILTAVALQWSIAGGSFDRISFVPIILFPIVTIVTHVLQQYSGLYTYSYDKNRPKMTRAYKWTVMVSIAVVGLLSLYSAHIGMCSYWPSEWSRITACHVVFRALVFGVCIGAPYMLVAMNRDPGRAHINYVSTVGTTAALSALSTFLDLTGVWYGMLKS